MKVIGKTGNDSIASVFIAQFSNGKLIEFVESVQPPLTRKQKWVIIVSTLFGCPVNCSFCDCGGSYNGKLTADEILAQIDFAIKARFPKGFIQPDKFKIQFARMGEPAFNPAVLDVLRVLPQRFNQTGLLPSLSTIAPESASAFFDELIEIKNELYLGNFQLQFSIHTTDVRLRDKLIPAKKWDFNRIASYGAHFRRTGDKKISLNFALAEGSEISTEKLLHYFNPDDFLIKITPVNPTISARRNNIESHVQANKVSYEIIDKLRYCGYEVILSIGELEENGIGSNCGQYVINYLNSGIRLDDGYTYPLETLPDADEINSMQHL
jgi:23S rRNA (adenine2503-C2)-methyltransferase